MNYTKILIAIFLLFSFALKAQEVSNVRFEQVVKQIYIYYDLQGEGTYKVSVYCIENIEENYVNALMYVTGAVGEDQNPGINKMIVWDVLKEREELSGTISFKMEAVSEFGNFTDKRDRQTYKSVKIGKQTWMAENLNYSTTGSWRYDSKKINYAKYGRLYNWKAAKTACPKGWHLPSDKEWKKLEMQLGMSQSEADDTGYRGTGEVKNIKSNSSWKGNSNDTNSSRFNALPGGYRYSGGRFYTLRVTGFWWSATEHSSASSWSRRLNYDANDIGRNYYDKESGYSIRCLKD
jgi:uncharacterized protein (TIGR02145 family)